MKISIRKSKSVLGFATEGGGSWDVWDRFITINGKKAYHIGNVCGTCPFFFECLEGADQDLNPKGLQAELTEGISVLTSTHAEVLRGLLPTGHYQFTLRSFVPRLVEPGGGDDYFTKEEPSLWGNKNEPPHDPKTRYYRGEDRPIFKGTKLFEFVIPMFSETRLEQKRVDEFRNRIRGGASPTALAISVLDIKQPADWDDDPDVTCHWCLAHYLVDGHHKVLAASKLGMPISVISMLAIDRGISDKKSLKMLQKM